jgi:hypothetical protein
MTAICKLCKAAITADDFEHAAVAVANHLQIHEGASNTTSAVAAFAAGLYMLPQFIWPLEAPVAEKLRELRKALDGLLNGRDVFDPPAQRPN